MAPTDPLAATADHGATARVVDDVVRARRTSLLVDTDRPVPDELVDRLVDAATWAPNHKRTWPWRFTVVTGEARTRLGAAMAERAIALGDEGPRVDKLRTKYRRSPTVLLVWQAVDPSDEVRAREDRDAVAAAAQTLLLTATAHGLASYWGTVADRLVPAVRAVAEVDDAHDLVALIYLGWPIGTVTPPPRPAPVVTRLD